MLEYHVIFTLYHSLFCCRQYFILTFKDKPLELWDMKTLTILREMSSKLPIPTALVSESILHRSTTLCCFRDSIDGCFRDSSFYHTKVLMSPALALLNISLSQLCLIRYLYYPTNNIFGCVYRNHPAHVSVQVSCKHHSLQLQ